MPVVEVTASKACGAKPDILQGGTACMPGFMAGSVEQRHRVTGDFIGGAVDRTGNNGDFHQVRIRN
jgi:hypothetical protein